MDEDVPGRRWQGSGALYHDSSGSFMGRRPIVTIGIINKYVCKLHSMEFQIEVVYGSSSPPVRVGHTRRRPLQAVILHHPREKSRRRELISIMKFPGSRLRLREGRFRGNVGFSRSPPRFDRKNGGVLVHATIGLIHRTAMIRFAVVSEFTCDSCLKSKYA